MADRFPDCDAKELQQFKENAEKWNTKKSTKTWAEEKGYSPDIASHESKELDEKLQKFFAEVRRKDGSDYESDSLRVMIASLDRHLKEAGSSRFHCQGQRVCQQSQSTRRESSLPP